MSLNISQSFSQKNILNTMIRFFLAQCPGCECKAYYYIYFICNKFSTHCNNFSKLIIFIEVTFLWKQGVDKLKSYKFPLQFNLTTYCIEEEAIALFLQHWMYQNKNSNKWITSNTTTKASLAAMMCQYAIVNS